MAHGDLAQLAAALGALGSVVVLLPQRRGLLVFFGFALLAAAEAMLAVALVPSNDLARFQSATGILALAVAALAIVALAVLLVRYPSLVAPCLLLAAPFRIPVDVGRQHAFLLLPLYAALGAAVLALLYRVARRAPAAVLPPALALPAAAFIALDGVSLFWSRDVEQGGIELLFFIFPFAALLTVVGRAPFAAWLPRVLAVELVALAAVFAAVGLYEVAARRVFFARDVEVANAYADFFRVTSVFKDPSIYARHLVLGIAVLLVVAWLARVNALIVAGLVAFLWAGLYVSYSQSGMVTLFAVAVAVTVLAADRRARAIVLSVCLVFAVAAALLFAAFAEGHSARRFTSGRSRLVTVTAEVIRDHPFTGVGVGAQPRASRAEAKRGTIARNASHTTPLTIAAELGAVGLVLYLAFLVASVWVLAAVVKRQRALGIGLAAVFLALVVHSLFYSGFFEDPITWGCLAVASASLASRMRVAEEGETPEAAPGRREARAAPTRPLPAPAPAPRGDASAG